MRDMDPAAGACSEVTRLLFVRHGETVSNVEDRYMGHLDSPVTANGLWQASAAAARLTRMGVDVLYTSDLGRALSTAAVIAEACGLEAVPDHRLRERHAGSFQGLLVEEARAQDPAYFVESATPVPDTAIRGGESGVQVRDRVVPLLAEACERHGGQSVVLVTHGIVIRTVLWHLVECSYATAFRSRVDNASLAVFHLENGRWSLRSWNDTGHLSDCLDGR